MNSRGRTREFVQSDRGERQINKFLEALAVVEGVGDLRFADLVATDGVRLNRNDTLLAISPDPSRDWALALQMLQRRGVNSIAVVIDGASFGAPRDYDPLLSELGAAGIPTYRIRRNDPIDKVLSQAPAIPGRR